MSRIEGPIELAADINKESPYFGNDTKTGIVSPLLPELTLELSDDELLTQSEDWLQGWTKFNKKLTKRQKDNERYWLGKQYSELDYPEDDNDSGYSGRPLVDNKLFEATETFLPIATRANPEPVVESLDPITQKAVKDYLIEVADTLRLKLKIKDVARKWVLYFVGVAEFCWNEKEGREDMIVLRPQKVILDPNATVVDGVHYTGKYIGVYQKDKASEIIAKFPDSPQPEVEGQANELSLAEYITQKVERKMGTEIQYIKWSTDDYCFYTLDKRVFGKTKNLYWNYESEQPGLMDEFGNLGQPQVVPGKNLFKHQKMPFLLLSIWNLGKHPVDDTNIFHQNLSIQDLINKRYRQIDRNNDNVNGGWAISGERTGMTKDQAAESVAAWREGGAVYVPGGAVDDAAVKKMIGQPLPPNSYEQLNDSRIELQNVFGTAGSTPQGIKSEDTVRGKILAKGTDDSRIGGGVSEYLEQFADQCFQWFVQIKMVFDPEFAALVNAPVKITVKEGSMIPKDSLTKRNEAIDLFSAGALSPIDLYKRLEDPNPEETYQHLLQWLIDQQAPQLMAAEQANMAKAQIADKNNKAKADSKGQLPPINPSQPDLLNEVPIQ